MVIIGSGVADGDDRNKPLIGWHNLVTAANIVSDTADAEFPITKVANPATFDFWVAGDTTDQSIDWTNSGSEIVDYLAIAGHNFGTGDIGVRISGSDPGDIISLVHFDAADAVTIIDDEAGPSWLAVGNAQIDTAQSKFGGSSALFDGTGDSIDGDGSSVYAFGANDFTIDFWVRLNATGIAQMLYDQRPSATNGNYVTIYLGSDNALRLLVNNIDVITGTTALTTGVWNHVAVARSGTSTKLFLNGTQEGSTFSDSTSYLNGASRPRLGADGTNGASALNGWIDELRVMNGTAAWTSTFTPPIAAYSISVLLTDTVVPDNDAPLIFRLPSGVYSSLILEMFPVDVLPQISVIYVGRILQLPRNIYVGHPVLTYNRRSNIVTGFSDEGQFLGRIVLGETRDSQINMQNVNPLVFRDDVEPWLESAVERPFFFAWRPFGYPKETGFVWATNDAQVSNQRPNGMMQFSVGIKGIVG